MPEAVRGAAGATAVAVVATAALVALNGCSGWSRRPPSAAPAATPTSTAPDPVQSSPRARDYCTNYAEAFKASSYPREAIIRGITYGKVVVRFRIDGSAITILSVDASDLAFAATATGIIQRFVCHTDRPTDFELPFTFERRP